tara:strand:- start:174 stop:476 length:303 start_codon:yes stop_codon:yes gene_type:complete
MATYKADSHLSNTKVNQKFTEFYEPSISQFNRDTKIVTLESKYHKRPDVLAHDLYGNSRLWWVFAHLNPDSLKNPIKDFQQGMKLRVPTGLASNENAGRL